MYHSKMFWVFLCILFYVNYFVYLCVYSKWWLFMCIYSNGVIILNKMCKIVGVYFNCMLKVRKKTNNLRYIAQLQALPYILIIRLRLKNIYMCLS